MNSWYTLFVILFYILGFLFALHALQKARTPQGATAWIVGLASFPFITIPLFLIFGRNKFNKYVVERKVFDKTAEDTLTQIQKLVSHKSSLSDDYIKMESIIKMGRKIDFTSGNRVQLLIDGHNTYHEMLKAIETAQEYILFQFYIFNDDETGYTFKEALVKKAKQGVKVYFLYDEIGSRISKKFVREMTQAGIQVSTFKNKDFFKNRFKINFRNHRKLVVIDGEKTFTGGHNIGNEYLGQSKLGYWRDTHIVIEGPAATASQFSFIIDWYWANNILLELNWEPKTYSENMDVCVLNTGPSDSIDVCLLSHLALMDTARKRIILSTPYFIPTDGIVNSLIMAKLRKCEVIIILPSNNDNGLVKAAESVYLEKLLPYGIQFFKYKEGFIHQKVILIDDHTTMIGSANLDSRSFFINFEISTICIDKIFASKVEKMLLNDLDKCDKYDQDDLMKRSFYQQIFSRAANLLAPIL